MSDPRIGTRIGGYEVESFLGRGGMGVVYRARHTRLGRLVALKVLVPELAEDETFRTRFVRESQMAASIDHPNVIPIYDADEIDGVLYLAMRYVDGTDLKVMIERDGALDLETSLSIVSQIAGALDAAHNLGLIHRDVKPANVLVDRSDGEPHIYLTDFGLTKHGSSRSGITKTGAFIGTIDYIAPEQIEGNPVDARTDVYALGCVLYECLTGEVPFKKDADVAVMYAHMMDPRPKATDRKPDLPREVDTVLAKAMARQPDDRYPSAGAMVADLRGSLGSASGIGTATEEPRVPVEQTVGGVPVPHAARRIPSRLLMLGLACLVVIAGVAYFATRDQKGGTSDPAASDSSGVIFVAPGGSVEAAGTRADPFDNLPAAVERAEEGGTVVLMDGAYKSQSDPMLEIDKAITITADEGATPVLQGDTEHPDGIYVVAGTSDVTISKVRFEDFDGEALKVFCEICENEPENANIRLEELEFTSGGSPIIVENVDGLSLQRVTLEENEHDGFLCSPGPCNEVTITDSFFHSANQPGSNGVTIESGNEVYIETSDASFNSGGGFVSAASSTQIVRSRATNNADLGVSLTGSDSEIRDSIVALNRDLGLLMGEGGCPGCAATGVFRIVNVLIADNGSGISIENDESDEITLQMFNSIITDNGGTALDVSGAVRITRLDYNLFDTAGAVAVSYRGTDYTENKLNHSAFPGDFDAGTYASTPTFEEPNDYHLAADSSGVNGGTQVGVVSQVDIDGNPRVSGDEIDMGPSERS